MENFTVSQPRLIDSEVCAVRALVLPPVGPLYIVLSPVYLVSCFLLQGNNRAPSSLLSL